MLAGPWVGAVAGLLTNLVLDEPTSQFDPIGTDDVFRAVADLSRQGMTVAFVEHKLDLLASVANRLILLSQGQIVLDGPTDQVLKSPELPHHGLEPPPITRLAQRLGLPGTVLTLDDFCRRLNERERTRIQP